MLEAVLLGVLQGATEFLPVSSSGHLRLAERFLGHSEGMLGFDVAVHVGTLVAVLIVFRRDVAALLNFTSPVWRRSGLPLLGRLGLASVPAFAVGGFLLLSDGVSIEAVGVRAVSVLLLVNGLWLLLGERLGGREGPPDITGGGVLGGRSGGGTPGLRSALLIGLAQSVAILPGISRSGATISTGLLCGLSRERAARFSFLLAIPAIAAAGAKELPSAASSAVGVPQLVAGTVAAALVGVLAIYSLLLLVRTRKLWVFAVYCWVVGLAALLASVCVGVS